MARTPPLFKNHPVPYGTANGLGFSRAVCQHVSDGDTVDFLIDLGWLQYTFEVIRLRGINTPELRGTTGDELTAARNAASRTKELILDRGVLIRSFKHRTTFGRFVADVFFIHPEVSLDEEEQFLIDGVNWVSLGALLRLEGHGKE